MEVKVTIEASLQVDKLPESDKMAIVEGIEEIQIDPMVGDVVTDLGPIRRLYMVSDFAVMYDLDDSIKIVSVTDITEVNDILFGLW